MNPIPTSSSRSVGSAATPPTATGRETPIVWDSGQFHHADGRIVAVLDLELAHLGDPMMDLAGWRMRDTVIPFGNFAELYDRYAELTGAPVDLDAIQIHHFFFTLTNQLAFGAALRDPQPDSDFMTNLQWCSETNLFGTEALGEYLGIELPDRRHPCRARLVGGTRARAPRPLVAPARDRRRIRPLQAPYRVPARPSPAARRRDR